MSLLPDLGSTIGGPLVAGPVNVSSPFDGLWLVQDGMALADAIGSGDWVMGGVAAFSLLLDGVAALIDPIGTLIGMGLSWVLEHIWPLNEYLNLLTGNAGEVLRMSQTWSNISAHLAGTGADLQRILGDLDALDGAAIEAYRNFQADMAKHLELAGSLAAATSAALEIASTIVKIVHDLTRDVISQIAGTAISAALTTVVTVGFGAPVAIAQIAARVAALVPKVTRAIETLLRSFEKLEPLLKQVDEIYFTLKRLLDRLVPGTHAPAGQHTAGQPSATGAPGISGLDDTGRPLTPSEMQYLSSQGYHTTIFGDQVAHHYDSSDALLGGPGSNVWAMPIDDAAHIQTPAQAARETGMAPTVLDAHLNGGDVYAVHFPVDPATLSRPTVADATTNGSTWAHFYDDPTNLSPTYGHTAVNTGSGAYLVNSTRETVLAGGGVMPPGAILTRLADGSWWIVRRF